MKYSVRAYDDRITAMVTDRQIGGTSAGGLPLSFEACGVGFGTSCE